MDAFSVFVFLWKCFSGVFGLIKMFHLGVVAIRNDSVVCVLLGGCD